MKTITKTAFLLLNFLILTLTSCSEEIKPSEDGKQTAIVYGVLNANDSIHYIKINKALSAIGDLSQSALIADSSYFDKVDATITETVNGVVTRTWTLNDTLIENKESGAFYYPEQKVYYFKTTQDEPLLLSKSGSITVYKFEANINDGEFKVSGQTELVGEAMTLSQPSEISQFSFASNNISLYGYSSTLINYNPGNCEKVEVFLDVEFEEFNNSTLINSKSFRWKISEAEEGELSAAMTTSANGQTFYELIAQNCTKDNPAINKRKLKGIRVVLDGASGDLQKYILVNKPSSSLAQNKPTFSNLTVTNGMRVVGLFTSRYDIQRYKQAWKYAGGSSYYLCLNTNSMKELCNGAITGEYLFCSDSPTDNTFPYFCD